MAKKLEKSKSPNLIASAALLRAQVKQNKKTIVYVTHNTKYSNYADTIYNFQNMKLTKIND